MGFLIFRGYVPPHVPTVWAYVAAYSGVGGLFGCTRAAFGALLYFHVPPARTPSRAAAFAGGPCVHAPQGGRPGSRAFVRPSRAALAWAVGGPHSPTTTPRWGRWVCGVYIHGSMSPLGRYYNSIKTGICQGKYLCIDFMYNVDFLSFFNKYDEYLCKNERIKCIKMLTSENLPL